MKKRNTVQSNKTESRVNISSFLLYTPFINQGEKYYFENKYKNLSHTHEEWEKITKLKRINK